MAVSGVLAATFVFAIALPLIYAGLALFWRKTKPSYDSAYKLMGNAVAVATSLQLLWLVFFGERIQGLTGQDRFYLLVGAVAAGWYGVSGILKTFNKLFGVQLNEEEEGL